MGCCRCPCLTQREEDSPATNANTTKHRLQSPRRKSPHPLNLCLPLVSRKDVGKPRRARSSSGLRLKSSPLHDVMLVFNGCSAFCDSHCLPEEQRRNRSSRDMESLEENGECVGDGVKESCNKVCNFAELLLEKEEAEEVEEEEGTRESVSSSGFLMSEVDADEGSEGSSSTLLPTSWLSPKDHVNDCDGTVPCPEVGKKQEKEVSVDVPEIEMMKERFAKLLLGEDMSGSGNGVCTALAISNAITNLCATIFGQLWRLEPTPPEKKEMWRREMEWLLSVSDHVVEFTPTSQTFTDGSKFEIMTCRPRMDLYVNLPALRKLDNMLLEILDGFEKTEFWYVDQGILALEANGSSSFRQSLPRQEEKWWLPVPRVPSGGLSEDSRKHLQHRRDSTNQILKAAMAINGNALAEIRVPESYLESLPKNGRACLGDVVYRYISSDQFSPECLLDCLDLTSEHQAIELANRVESSMHIWRRRSNSKPVVNSHRSNSRSSWDLVKDLMVDAEKRDLLAERAETLLLCLKQWFPGLPQTTLDMSKIQCNKDVGKSILESYSRVLESLAFNIVARIDDILYVDDLTKHSDTPPPLSKVGLVAQKSVSLPYVLSISGTPYKTAFSTPNFSPARLFSPVIGERSPFTSSRKLHPRGLGLEVKKVLTDHSAIDAKGKGCNRSDPDSHAR
ncbi:hypothetical protein MLD38_029933 [Melastoma candidum]|uniref:Uncharacterized protein n=1 Tax=Melastoma candidum TaxID=119954 RepID=A0ACB9MK74_9MYRT|nr:hypothetical protein MLD38_029933 [Melastoma candidum]